ncbi:hypothetical protein Tco_1166798 [Tanacetum coccineum]
MYHLSLKICYPSDPSSIPQVHREEYCSSSSGQLETGDHTQVELAISDLKSFCEGKIPTVKRRHEDIVKEVDKSEKSCNTVDDVEFFTLGYGALRHQELALEEGDVYSTFEVGHGSGSALEYESPERTSGLLPISPSPSDVPSPISSAMIPLTIPSPVTTPAIAETEGFLTELGAQEFGVRAGEGRNDIQSDMEASLAEERRARLELVEVVDSMRRGQEPRGAQFCSCVSALRLVALGRADTHILIRKVLDREWSRGSTGKSGDDQFRNLIICLTM